MSTQDFPAEFKDIWLSNGLPEEFLANIELTGDADAAVQSSFRVGHAAQISVGLASLSAAYLYYLRTGVVQNVTVNARHAALAFHSEAWYTINDRLPNAEVWDSIAGLYKTQDDNYVRIHSNFPHHRKGVLDILRINDSPSLTRANVAEAIRKWDSFDFEAESAKRGMCVTAMRSFDVWKQHPQAKALEGVPPVVITKVANSGDGTLAFNPLRPLDGVNVLDLTRVLAGPVAGKTLAAQGASVLLITSSDLPALPVLDVETSAGKSAAQLDLTKQNDRHRLALLAETANVFLQTYRPGGLKEKGFGVDDLLTMRKGESIVSASLTAWGWDGPWKDRRGFDSLVQTATGFNVDEGTAYGVYSPSLDKVVPRPLPMQALDHSAGYLLAFGVNVALSKAFLDGGSYEVQVSLAAVGEWIRSLGRLSPSRAFALGKPFPSKLTILDPEGEVAKLSVSWKQSHSREGRMRTLRHAGILEKTPVREGGEEAEAPMRLDADEAVWI